MEGSGSGNVEAAEAAPPANHNQHDAKEEIYWRKQVFWSRWTTIFAALAFTAAAIYADFANQQVTAMNQTVAESQQLVCETQQLVLQQTEATLAAQKSADAANLAATTAHEAFVVNVSADLVPDIDCDITGNDMQIKIRVINKGNSVAKDVWLGWWFVDGGKDACRGGPKNKSGAYEGGTYNRVSMRLEKNETSDPMGLAPADSCTGEQTSAMEQAAVIDIQNGTRNFSIAGHIDYTDVAGGYHLVPFRYGYTPIYGSSTPAPWTCKFSVVQPGNSVYANQ